MDPPPRSAQGGERSLERYRNYLQFLARVRLGHWLQGKMSSSDVVQETLLKAHQHRDDFRGQTEEEWRAYLRRILANTVADACRHLGNEQDIVRLMDESSAQLEAWLLEQTSPSMKVQKEELLVHLGDALAQLPADQRTAVEMRYLREPRLSLEEIAKELNRPSAKAVAGLLHRGLEKLRSLLNKHG
jgi:RNA polymerase sigma-70 factor (ECF subfamily)